MSTGQSGYASEPPHGAPPQVPQYAQPQPPAPQPAPRGVRPPASLGTRVLVYLIDMALIGAAAGLIGGPLTMLVGAGVAPQLVQGDPLGYLLLVLVPTLVGVALVAAYVAMQGAGGSFAQRWLKVRLVRDDTGERLGFGRALVRHIIWALAATIVVGYFSVFFDRSGRRQGWHDRVAKALVVDVSAEHRAPSGTAPAAPPSWQPDPRLTGATPPPVPPQPGAPFAAPPAPQDPFAAHRPSAAASPDAPRDPFAASPQAQASPGGPYDAFAAPALAPIPPRPAAPPAPVGAPPAGAQPQPPESASMPEPIDPFAGPAPAAPPAEAAPRVADEGPIAFVPGVTGEPPAGRPAPAPADMPPAPAPAAVPEPVAEPEPIADMPPAPTAADVPGPAPVAPADEFPDDTIVIDRAAPPAPSAPPSVVLVWDDGRRTTATSRTIFGRNPVGEPGAEHIAIVDDTLSLSKTHFEVSFDGEQVVVVDRHSTNGVVLERDGATTDLAPGVPTPLTVGDVLAIGDRRATVERAGRA
ncbi:RDD family protein [Microbacterium karelineae]|uniref:RDD family protein n=1 Tax=Microbacterium karelineae TaxID=2654283 RepID=UPI0027D25427|nr:RDD family protein [Microbacterium karelineae]